MRKPRVLDRLTQKSKIDIFKFLEARLEKEFKFFEGRQWKFDFALPEAKVAIEIEGGIFSGGRHTRSVGYLKDLEKYNTATKLGWRIFRYAPWQFDVMMEDIGEQMGWIKP